MKKFMVVPAIITLAMFSCARNTTNPPHSYDNAPAGAKTIGPPAATIKSGRSLFLKNCAHCHGADARGDEGPDLHQLDWTDQQIANRIRIGKKGQMTAFAGKLQTSEINALIIYLRTLK